MTKMTGIVKWPLVLATVLVMLMAFAGAALATNWPQFQFNERNIGTTSDSAPSLLPDNTWSQYTHSGGWSGIDTTPIVLGDHVYVLADDGRLYKFNKTGGNAVWSAVVDENSGFQLATPATDGTNIYAAVNEFTDVITNGNFQSNTNDWSTQTVAGSPEFSWDSTGHENGGCAKISETDASTNGEGYYYQGSLNFSRYDKVRLYYAWKKGYETSAPSQQDIYITIEKPDGTTVNIDSQTGVPAAYDTWYTVNKDVSSSAFNQNGNYKIRLRYDYETTVGGKAYAWFDEVKLFKEKMKVKKVSNLGNDNPTVTTLFDPQRGQANTPVTYENGYIYLGSWPGNDRYGRYYCVRTSDGNKMWEYTAPERPGQTSNGYYWAGAAVVGNYVVFGDDQSYLTVLNKVYGNVIDQDGGQAGNQPFDLLTIHNEDSNRRQVRSSVHYDGAGKIYFTSRKYLWCFGINNDGVLTHRWDYNLESLGNDGGCSTSTPVVYNNRVYVGKGSFGTGSGHHLFSFYAADEGVHDEGDWNWTFEDANGGVQSSPVISSSNSLIYFTTNCTYGRVYCVNSSGVQQWYYQSNQAGTSGGNILQGVAASDGWLFFGNDGGYLYGIKRN